MVATAALTYQVVDPRSALFQVPNYLVSVELLVRVVLRSVIPTLPLDECLQEKPRLSAEVRAQIEPVLGKWGMRVHRVEVLDVRATGPAGEAQVAPDTGPHPRAS